MSELQRNTTPLRSLSSIDDAAKTNALIAYILMVVGLFTGLFWIIGFILAFVVIGYFILIGVWIWSIYRIIKGLAKITSNKAYNS